MDTKPLRRKLLTLAIQGHLVPQDPTDEPASQLLRRIQAEKAKLVKEGKLKKATLNDSTIFRGEDNKYYEKAGKTITCIDKDIPFEIPETWEWVRLGNVFSIIMGQSPDGNSVYENKDGTEFHQGKIYFQDKYLAQSNQITTEPSKIAPPNSILLCVRAPVGKVNITKRTICIGRGLCALVPMCDMSVDFCFYLLSALENIFIRSATGTTFLAITGEVVKNLLLPLPPLAEQRRIVAKVEEVLSVVERYEKAQDALDALCNSLDGRLRKSILSEAIQGHLVPQDPTDEPASQLLRRIQAEKAKLVKEGKLKKSALSDSSIFRGEDNKYYEKTGKTITCIDEEIPFEIPETWEWVRLGSIGEIITGCTPPKEQSKYYGGDIPFFKPTDLEQGKDVRESNDHLTQLGFDQSRKLPPNSVLVTCIGATIGKTGKLSVYGSCNQQINAIVPNSAVLPDFVYYTCNSSYMQNKIKSEASATTLPILNKNNFSTLLLPLPPLPEQHRIVAKLEEVFAVLDRLAGK